MLITKIQILLTFNYAFIEYSDIKLQSPLNVIAIKSYVAKQEHELTLNKDEKFDVIGRISNAWLIGVLDGRRGTFPAECVKVRNHFLIDVTL